MVQASAEEQTAQKAAAEEAAAVLTIEVRDTKAALAASEANIDHLLVCSSDSSPTIVCARFDSSRQCRLSTKRASFA